MNNQADYSMVLEYRDAGRYDEGLAWLSDRLSHHPEDVRALTLQAHLLMLVRKDTEAAEALARAQALEPASADVSRNLARLFLKQRQATQALPYAQAACLAQPDSSENQLVYATCLAASGQLGQALPLVEQICTASPEYAEAWASRAQLLANSGCFNEAISAAQRAVTIKPHLAATWVLLATAQHRNGRLQEAIKALINAVHYEPNVISHQVALGEYLRQVGDTEGALKLLAQVVQQAPADAIGWANYGTALQTAGQPEQAEQAYRNALKINPALAEVANNLGALARDRENWQQALAYFQQATQLQPENPTFLINLGISFHKGGMLGEAEQVAQKVLQKQPDHFRALRLLGDVALARRQFDQAETCFRRSVTLQPDDPDAALNMALLQQSKGDLGTALASYQKAIRLQCTQYRAGIVARPKEFMDVGVAHRALLAFHVAMEKLGGGFFLAYGTLLGIVRDGDLLPHDKDMDVGLGWDVPRRPLLAALEPLGFACPRVEYQNEADLDWNIALTHLETGICIDLFFFKQDGEFLLSGFNHLPVPLLWRFPLFKLQHHSYLERKWLIPSPPENYLEAIYGTEWRVPDPFFDSVISGKNRTKESAAVALCFAYNRLYERLKRREWSKASGYCRQILAQRHDGFVVELGHWIASRAAEAAGGCA